MNWSTHERGDDTADVPGHTPFGATASANRLAPAAQPQARTLVGVVGAPRLLQRVLPGVLHRGASPAPARAHLGPRDAGPLVLRTPPRHTCWFRHHLRHQR